MRSKSLPKQEGGQPVHTHGVVDPIFWTEKRPFLISVWGNRLDLGSPELGQALVAEAVTLLSEVFRFLKNWLLSWPRFPRRSAHTVQSL